MKDLRKKLIDIFIDINSDAPPDVLYENANFFFDIISHEIEEAIGEEKNKLYKGKVLCNCDCGGPFCNDLIHQCRKPNIHYPQREKAIIEIRNNLRKEIGDTLREKGLIT
jgi:hypothetical protein